MGGPQSRFERFGDDKILLSLPGFEPRIQSITLKAIPARKQSARHNNVSDSGCTAPHILSLGARWSGHQFTI